MSDEWNTRSGDCAVCGAHTAKYPLCDACWSECIDAGDEYCGASSAWIVDKVRARCAKICESSAKRYEELAIAARESRGPLSNSEANEYMWAAECARQQAKQIRGEK